MNTTLVIIGLLSILGDLGIKARASRRKRSLREEQGTLVPYGDLNRVYEAMFLWLGEVTFINVIGLFALNFDVREVYPCEFRSRLSDVSTLLVLLNLAIYLVAIGATIWRLSKLLAMRGLPASGNSRFVRILFTDFALRAVLVCVIAIGWMVNVGPFTIPASKTCEETSSRHPLQ
ncbi:MAG: hypothetical protein U1G07_23435 [Verrucomicrobiota bacterium]